MFFSSLSLFLLLHLTVASANLDHTNILTSNDMGTHFSRWRDGLIRDLLGRYYPGYKRAAPACILELLAEVR